MDEQGTEERRHGRWGHSLKAKLFLLRIGIGLLMALVIGTATYYTVSLLMMKQQMELLERDSALLEDLLVRHCDMLQNNMEHLGDSEQVRKYIQTGREILLHELFQSYADEFDSIAFVGARGRERFKVIEDRASDNLQDISLDKNYLKALTQPGVVTISNPRYLEDINDFGIYCDILLTDFFDQRIGFLRTSLSLSRFEKLTAQAAVMNHVQAYVTTDTGQIISSPDNSELGLSVADGGHRLFNMFAASTLTQKQAGTTVINDVKHRYVVRTYEKRNWKVFLVASLKELNIPIARMRDMIIAICLAVVLAGELISRFIGLRVTEPIDRLNELAQSIIESGRLSQRVWWHSQDELGQLARSMNTMLDQLEKANRELSEEKHFVDSIVDAMIDGMVTTSAQGRIRTVNDRLLDLLGYSEAELVEQHYDFLFAGASPPLTGSKKINFVIKERVRLDDITVVTKKSLEIPVACSFSVLKDQDGQANGLLLLITDIRKRKELEYQRAMSEERLHQTQEELLKTEKIAIVGQMAGLVAHEVLNPVSAISVRLDLGVQRAKEMNKVITVLVSVVHDWQSLAAKGELAEYLGGAGQQDLALIEKISQTLQKRQLDRLDDLEFMQRQNQRVIKIIDNLREMSRREKALEKVDLRALLDELLDDMQDGIEKRRIDVVKHYEASPMLMADVMEIYSIFSNVMKNSVQSIEKQPPGRQRRITITLGQGANGQARVVISDTGLGMDERTAAAIFTPGFTSKGRQGTGIGSSFARKLARHYNGDIEVLHSVPGEGTDIQVLLGASGSSEEDEV